MTKADEKTLARAETALDDFKKSLDTIASAALKATDKASESLAGAFGVYEKFIRDMAKELEKLIPPGALSQKPASPGDGSQAAIPQSFPTGEKAYEKDGNEANVPQGAPTGKKASDPEREMTEKFASGQFFDDFIIKSVQDGTGALADTFTSLFETILAGSDAWKDFGQAGTSTLAKLLESLGQTLFATSAAAIILGALNLKGYKDFNSYGKAAIGMAAGAAAMASAAALKTIKFANGGIVPQVSGVPSTGDRIFARLNPGEVVLNQKQQATALMALANGGGNPARRGGLNINIINNAGIDVSADYNDHLGLLDVYIENKVKNTLRSPSGARIMGAQFALKRQPVRRA